MLAKIEKIKYNSIITDLRSEILNSIILSALRCPVCHGAFSLSENQKSLVCENRHCFDIAASGYVNLCPTHGGDSKEAVRARREFLSLGYYRPIADTAVKLLEKYSRGNLVADLGCGEGYYGDAIAKSGYSLLGFDLSKPAIEAAAKRKDPNAFYAVAGIFDIPMKDSSADALTNIFAPCAEEEYTRVLKSGGVLIVAGAGEDHLHGLKAKIYDTPSKNTVRADLPKSLAHKETVRLKYEITLKSNAEIKQLFAMTPYYYRTDAEGFARLDALDTVTTEIDVLFDIYTKN